jgi:hypothetical protein
MTLNAPRVLYFIVALLIALVAVASVYISALGMFPSQPFWLMTIAFVILALACVIKA